MKTGTVALIVSTTAKGLELLTSISDDQEIAFLEVAAQTAKHQDLLALLEEFRKQQAQQDEEFCDYVENLLSKPFLQKDVREHAVQWFKSRIKMESIQVTEREASDVIADFAFKIFTENPKCRDFFLAGPRAKVRIRVFDASEAVLEVA